MNKERISKAASQVLEDFEDESDLLKVKLEQESISMLDYVKTVVKSLCGEEIVSEKDLNEEAREALVQVGHAMNRS